MKINHERRKEWKKMAKTTVKKHYILLVMIALLGGFLGVESGYGFNREDLSSARTTEIVNENKAISKAGKDVVNNVKDITKQKNDKYTSVITEIMEGNFAAGEKISSEQIDDEKSKTKNTNTIVGRTNGILAGVVNDITSGMLMVRLGAGIKTIVGNKRVAGAVAILLVLSIYFIFWFFITNTYKVMLYRTYLEARTYEKVPVGHVVFFITVKRWRKVAKAMFRTWLYQFLWALTIVGGIIKHYSYWCVPLILAENPDMTGKEAITLSRKMMNGHKWETFVFELSFLGWEILSIITFGILKILFVSPYERAAEANLFAAIREERKIEKLEGMEKLKDQFLYERTDPEVLAIKYGDILYRKTLAKKAEVKLTGVRRFLVENFGLWVGTLEEQKRYEEVDLEEFNIERASEAAAAITYPERYNHLWNATAEESTATKNNYLKSYSIWTIIVMFALFAFMGWAWEVGLHLVKDGVFINRGAMHGPWLPIYGSGGALILLLLNRLRKKPGLLALATILLCGLVEYFTSFFMEMSNGIRWWDYTGYFLNLNGRICAEGLIVFAIGGMAAVYLIAPALDKYVQKINPKVLVVACIIYVLCFLGDTVYSHYYPNVGKGITDYDNFKQVESSQLYQPLDSWQQEVKLLQ